MMGGVCGPGSVRVRSAAMTSETVELFTDGACSGNPGPGGWAFVLVHPASGKKIERAGAERLTTNNRMELRAVIEGLSSLHEPSIVELTMAGPVGIPVGVVFAHLKMSIVWQRGDPQRRKVAAVKPSGLIRIQRDSAWSS